MLNEQRQATNDRIVLNPQCSLCGMICYIHEDGMIEHVEYKLCTNSGKKYKFDIRLIEIE